MVSPENNRHDQRDWLRYQGGDLQIEGAVLRDIVATVPTPFYCYSTEGIRTAYETLSIALEPVGVAICFAVKANSNITILRILSDLGCGMDVVSGGELERVLAAGVPASRVIFSGVGKTRNEIRRAIEAGIHQINVESAAEIDVIIEVARFLRKRAAIALRVNPDVDAKTHAKITTATKDSKFGIPIDDVPDVYSKALTTPELDVKGLAIHIGSQVHDLSPFRNAFSVMADLVVFLRSKGMSVPRLDLGGGIGIAVGDAPGPDITEYAEIVAETVGSLGCELTVEPGRFLVGRSGFLVTELLYLKGGAEGYTGIVDAGMNDLIRPALYEARHPVLPLHQPRQTGTSRRYRLVGPICESSDEFGAYDELGDLHQGDLLAFDCAGAYGATMASTYNSRDLVAEILIDGDRFRTIRQRQDIDAMLKLEEAGAWHSGLPIQKAAN